MSQNPTVWAGSERVRLRIEEQLETDFSARPKTELLRAARYIVQGGGHRWRGLMAVAAGCMFHPEAEVHVLPLASALEMMHAASLVLDDLPSMDNAKDRRGKACVHLVFPPWVVDMLPAFLVNLAYHVCTDNPSVPEECRFRTLLLIGEMGSGLAQGQELDLALATSSGSESELLECYALKSGSLFAAALAGGALLCGADSAEAVLLREAGLKLGQAYQMLDDIADGPEEVAKEPGRCTAFSLFGREGARIRAANLLAEVAQTLDRFGASAAPLRGVLEEIMMQPDR